MVYFDARSPVIEVHSSDGEGLFYIHEHLLRQQFGNYGLMIDEAIRTVGKASIQLGLSDGALKEWFNWIYGEPMASNCDTDYFEPHLELYEYCHENSRPKVDYECANACLDGTREMLTIGLDELGADEVFGSCISFVRGWRHGVLWTTTPCTNCV